MQQRLEKSRRMNYISEKHVRFSMNVFALASDIMNVRIDAESGETVELIRNGDPMKMNWIAPSSG